MAVHAAAAAFYTGALEAPAGGAGPRGYLRGRGVSPQAALAYRLGYAPASWTALTRHLREAGFTPEQIEASELGLATARGTVVDRFRDRIMFPVDEETGTVIAFLGRAAPGTHPDTPRWLNSPPPPPTPKARAAIGVPSGRAPVDTTRLPATSWSWPQTTEIP